MSHALPMVFIVDDEASVRKALARLLRSAGYNVAAFGSAEEFLCDCNLATPGCLLLDIAMPDLNGLELQQQLNTSGARWPIIFLTARADASASIQAANQGAFDFLTKPVNDVKLLAVIEKALQHDLLNRDQLQDPLETTDVPNETLA